MRKKYQAASKHDISDMKKQGKTKMYVVGGSHGRTAVAACIDLAEKKGMTVPWIWTNWPARIYWLPEPLAKYKVELVTLGKVFSFTTLI